MDSNPTTYSGSDSPRQTDLVFAKCWWGRRLNVLLAAWFVFGGANLGLAQIAVRIPDRDLIVYSISHFGDETWLATDVGAYRIKGDSPPQRIPDKNLIVPLDRPFWGRDMAGNR